VLEWAVQRGKPFGNADVAKHFKLCPGHATDTLAKLVNTGTPLRRVRPGEFAYGNDAGSAATAATAAPRKTSKPAATARGKRAKGKAPREGSLPARVLEWAAARGKPFGNTDVEKRFKLSRAHASMVTSTLANGPYPIRRKERGVYEFAG
jgi:hypothetical protein